MAALRGRLMAYSKGMPGGRLVRGELQQVKSLMQLEGIAEGHLRSAVSAAPTLAGPNEAEPSLAL